MQAMPLSQQDLAAALGVDPSWVTRYKAKGLPTHSVEAAQAWRRENVRPRVNPAVAGDGAGGRVPPAPPAAAAAGGGRGDGDGDYWKSRARREEAEAELAELKLSEQRGELVRAADVRAAYAKKAAALREALLQIPARLAAVLAAETDHSKCHDTLQLELHQVLAQVTEA
jgi:Zn-dependent protease with chaperone function